MHMGLKMCKIPSPIAVLSPNNSITIGYSCRQRVNFQIEKGHSICFENVFSTTQEYSIMFPLGVTKYKRLFFLPIMINLSGYKYSTNVVLHVNVLGLLKTSNISLLFATCKCPSKCKSAFGYS